LEGPGSRGLCAFALATLPPAILATLPVPALERLAELDRTYEIAPWSTLLALGAALDPALAARLGWCDAPRAEVVPFGLLPPGPPRRPTSDERRAIDA